MNCAGIQQVTGTEKERPEGLGKMDKMMMMKLPVYTMSLLMVVLFPAIQGNLEMERRCNLQMDSSGTDGCHAQGHSAYPVYNCRPCGVSGRQEVHIINMHQGIRRNVLLRIVAIHPVHIKLLLSSHQIVRWKISKPDFVEISQVIRIGVYNAYPSVTLWNGMQYVSVLNVTSRRRHFQLLDETGITDYARSNLGAVSSFSAVYKTCGWWLTVGNCISSKENQTTPTQLPDAIWTLPDLTDCSNRLPCWIKYDFRFPLKRLRNQCTGDRYVTWYRIQDTTYYVGAILCTNSRYSLFMSTSMRERFLHITDSDYRGEDHCELVGTDREYIPNINIELENTFLTGVMAYSRGDWGKPFQKIDTNVERKIDRRPRWYECGITIPYSKKLYTESVVPGASPIPTEEPKSSNRGQYAIFIVLTGMVVIALGFAGKAMFRDGLPKCIPKCFVRNQNEEPEQIPEPPATPLLPLPSAPPLTLTEPELPSAPSLAHLPILALPPPAYKDAMNYPRVETPPPTYDSV